MIFFILLSQMQSLRDAKFEKGNVQIMDYYQSSHILQTSTALPRFIEVQVKLQTPFEIQPQVFITSQRSDWEYQLPNGFMEKVSYIKTTGFKLRAYAVSTYPLYGISVDWVAFDDPRLKVITFESNDLQDLTTGSGMRSVQFTIEHLLQDATKAIIALIGIRHTYYNFIVELKIEQLNSKTVIVSANTYTLAQLNYIKFNILLGTDQSLWTSPELSFTLDMNANHPFISRSYYNAEVIQTILISQEQFNHITTATPLIAKRGYDVDQRWNPCQFLNVSLVNQDIKVVLGLWSHTYVYGVYYQVALYDLKFKIPDQNCAQIFSECDYAGDSLVICQSVSDLTSNAWSQPIKSLTVPTGRLLTLYQSLNYQGTKSFYTQNQQCLSPNSYLSAAFKPQISFIKILYLNLSLGSTCRQVIFYSQCNYQGSSYTLNKGEHLGSTQQIPFEIKSINICPDIVVQFRDPKYQGGEVKMYQTSQSCLSSFQFPKYRKPA
ncbi:unnamed protein product [Paramecium octaurelia]|uniref:H-type lectin domain-containing protein n=1 Tax=Paramecium octaurelia TaxID=43137 RepID=A0A8S1YDH9_PAROT|nr:unnamed protein product [Paramecium octaurelia]